MQSKGICVGGNDSFSECNVNEQMHKHECIHEHLHASTPTLIQCVCCIAVKYILLLIISQHTKYMGVCMRMINARAIVCACECMNACDVFRLNRRSSVRALSVVRIAQFVDGL